MMKRIFKNKYSPLIMLGTWLPVIGTRIFIGIKNGCETSVYSVLGTCALTLFLTFLYGCHLFIWDDKWKIFYKDTGATADGGELISASEEPSDNLGLHKSLCAVLTITVICLLSFVEPKWRDVLDLFGDDAYIKIGCWALNKMHIYNVLTLIVFPLWTTFIVRKVKERGFTAGSVLSGTVQVVALTIVGFFPFMYEPGIWIIKMAVLNTITLILAVGGYAWNVLDFDKKRNMAILIILYGLLWVALIFMFGHRGQYVGEFMGFTDRASVSNYHAIITRLWKNAPFVGQNIFMMNDSFILSFMEDNSALLVPCVLFYGGWLPAVLFIFAEILFAAAVLWIM